MRATDEKLTRRSEKLSAALTSLEDYIKEVVTNDGMKQEEITEHAIVNLRRSMQANAEFHEDMAAQNETAGNRPGENHHKAMANIYRSLL